MLFVDYIVLIDEAQELIISRSEKCE